MFQKFYDDNITTKYVKELIASTYIPNIDVWDKGMPIVKGLTYISKDNYIIRANTTWPTIDDLVGPQYSTDTNYFDIIEPYVFGKWYKNLSSNYISNIEGYDPMVHYQLGNYLRFVNKFYDINLMPFYNCWCGEYSDKIRFDTTRETYPNILKIDSGILIVNNDIKFEILDLSNDYIQASIKLVGGLNRQGSYLIDPSNTDQKYYYDELKGCYIFNIGKFHTIYVELDPINSGSYVITIDSKIKFNAYLSNNVQGWFLEIFMQYNQSENWIKDYANNLFTFDNNDNDYKINPYTITSISSYGVYDITESYTNDTRYKTFMVPIKYNKKYTIYYNSNSPIYLGTLYYDGISKVNGSYGPYNNDIVALNSISFIQPYEFNGVNITDYSTYYTQLREEYLYLAIQVPSTNTSGLVVLEGSYKNIQLINNTNQINENVYNKISTVVYGKKDVEDTNSKDFDFKDYFIGYPSILRFSDNNYAFSDRLLEFLTLNVINNADLISTNIKRIQEYSSSRDISNYNKVVDIFKFIENDNYSMSYVPANRLNPNDIDVKGVWDLPTRKFLYNLTKNNMKQSNIFDLTGFVDKDVEQIITRGKDE